MPRCRSRRAGRRRGRPVRRALVPTRRPPKCRPRMLSRCRIARCRPRTLSLSRVPRDRRATLSLKPCNGPSGFPRPPRAGMTGRRRRPRPRRRGRGRGWTEHNAGPLGHGSKRGRAGGSGRREARRVRRERRRRGGGRRGPGGRDPKRAGAARGQRRSLVPRGQRGAPERWGRGRRLGTRGSRRRDVRRNGGRRGCGSPAWSGAGNRPRKATNSHFWNITALTTRPEHPEGCSNVRAWRRSRVRKRRSQKCHLLGRRV
jgi:hypothetical protein